MHLILIGALALSAQQRPPLQPAAMQFVSHDQPTLALTHVRVIDGRGAPAREDQTILISGARIQAVGPFTSTSIPANVPTFDLRGHTVIPGLVQLHEHSYFGGVRRMTQMSTSGPLLYLAFGVTTAMSGGAQFPYMELNQMRAIEAGSIPGPRYLVTGPYLNGGPPRPTHAAIVNTPKEVRESIDFWAAQGATWFKFQGNVTREVLGAAIQHAHSKGLKVTGHLCSITYTEASALGIDLLQHGYITNSDYVPSKQPDACPPENMRIQTEVDVNSAHVQSTIRQIAARGTAVASTLAVYETFSPTRAKLIPEAMEMLDPETRKEVEANHAALAQSGLTVSDQLLRKMMKWERDFVAAGGLLGAGSDPWGTGFLPGFGNMRNYELLVEAGFTPETAIQIMTYNGARILGREREVGSIAAGKIADLVVIRGNPSSTIPDIYNVVTVFKDGRGYDSMKLRNAARGLVGVR